MSSTVPYIGSKISLVSNSDIRYEGILYTINTQESTIALQSVRCCGTEGRKVPEIPPSSEIYDFIIFRGQDIKDLTVLESANPALSAQLNDPAIMSVNQRPAGAGGAKASGKGTSTGGGGGGASGYGGGSSYSKGTGGGGGSYGKGTSTGGGYGSGKGWSSSGGGGGGGGWNKQDRGNDRSYGNSYGGSGGRSSGGWNNNNDGYNSKGSGKQKSSSTETTKGSKGGKTSSKGKEKGSGKTSDKGGKGSKGGKSTEKGGSGGDKGGNSGRRGGGEGNSSAVAQVTGELVPSVNEAEKSKYNEDFDYEGENKQFEKAKIDVEGEEIEEKLKPLSGYDKGKSFFDNISCEATERAGDAERPKVDRNKARQNDRETFGDTRRPPRPTGGRRGKGGRRGAPRGYRN